MTGVHLGKNVSYWNCKWRTHYGGQECKHPWGCLEHCMKGSGERLPEKDFRGREGRLKWMEDVSGKQQPAEKTTGQPRRRLSNFF